MRAENISIICAIFTILVLLIAKNQGEKIEVYNFLAVLILLGLTFIFPLFSVVILVPVCLLAWFKYYGKTLTFLKQIKEGKKE